MLSRQSAVLLLLASVLALADKECFCGTLHDPVYMGDACSADIDCTDAHE